MNDKTVRVVLEIRLAANGTDPYEHALQLAEQVKDRCDQRIQWVLITAAKSDGRWA